jgi:hypothetical protein
MQVDAPTLTLIQEIGTVAEFSTVFTVGANPLSCQSTDLWITAVISETEITYDSDSQILSIAYVSNDQATLTPTVELTGIMNQDSSATDTYPVTLTPSCKGTILADSPTFSWNG